jgi:hypothetical protein
MKSRDRALVARLCSVQGIELPRTGKKTGYANDNI